MNDVASPRASIIIVNRDDRGIAATLEVLRTHVSTVPFEVIVVDASRGRLSDIEARHRDVRWVNFTPPSSSGRTIGEQRNLGVETATGSIIVFLDAHCLPQVGWLDALVSPILAGKASIAMGTVIATGEHDFRDLSGGKTQEHDQLREFSTLNVAIARDVFDTVGRFAYPDMLGEDVDLSWRAVDAGFTIVLAPDAQIAHDWGGMREEFRRSYRYGRGRTMLYLRHKHRRKDLLGSDLHVLVYPMIICLLPVALVFPLVLVVLAIPLYRSRDNHPALTMAHHLVYGLGSLRQFFASASKPPPPLP